MKHGFINIHRRILNWAWYKNDNVKIVFIHLLLKANFTKKNWEDIVVKRGSLVTGINKLSTELDMSSQKIRLALKKLEKTNEIHIKTTNKYSIITICNYDVYQGVINVDEQRKTKETANKEQSKTKQTTTTNNLNKVNNEEKTFYVPEDISGKLRLKILDFIEYRKDIKKPFRSQKSIDSLVENLKKYEVKIAIQQIENSITNGWQGIFPLKNSPNTNKNKLSNLKKDRLEL